MRQFPLKTFSASMKASLEWCFESHFSVTDKDGTPPAKPSTLTKTQPLYIAPHTTCRIVDPKKSRAFPNSCFPKARYCLFAQNLSTQESDRPRPETAMLKSCGLLDRLPTNHRGELYRLICPGTCQCHYHSWTGRTTGKLWHCLDRSVS